MKVVAQTKDRIVRAYLENGWLVLEMLKQHGDGGEWKGKQFRMPRNEWDNLVADVEDVFADGEEAPLP